MTAGVYENPQRARQLIRFDGMSLMRKCFTDFDAVMEWNDRAWLVFEVKWTKKDVPTGQRLALERFVRDASKAGKYACAAVVEHAVRNPMRDVYLKNCKVRSVYCTGELEWRPTKNPVTALELMEEFTQYVGGGNGA